MAAIPVQDLRDWADKIDAVEGDAPSIMLTTKKVWRALAKNAAMIKYYYPTTAKASLPNLLKDERTQVCARADDRHSRRNHR